MRIEQERDYDILTGLYNRQAFHRVSEELFRDPHQLGVAALLMMDLDNLKHINDTYGHDWGDQYIHRTGRCLAENTPNGTIPPPGRSAPAFPAMSSCCCSTAIPVRIRSVRRSAP